MENPTTQNNLLEICKTKIARKFGQVDYGKWVNNDFIRLSEDILETTKKYISPSSLKRIFGKVTTEASPKKTTLDILAQYIEYKDWLDFSKQNNSLPLTIRDNAIPDNRAKGIPGSKKRVKLIILLSGMFALFVTITLVYYYFSTSLPSSYNFEFKQIKQFGKAPFTANFKVDVKDIPTENITIDFSDPFETDLKFTHYKLSSQTQSVAHTYMIPGVYHPQLKLDKNILDSLDIPVYSNGWEWVVVNYHDKSPTFYTIKDHPSFRKNGVFCIPSSEVAKYKVDTITNYCMRYLNYQNFNTDADGLKLELKTRNPILLNNKCTDIEIQLKFLHWNVGFMLFHKGCNGNYSRVQLGSKVLNGINNDLSMFEVDLNQWQNLTVEIKNQTAYISANGISLYEGKIEGSLGSFQGISIASQESAEVDYLYINSLDKVLLRENF
jgi:hypothetical protein